MKNKKRNIITTLVLLLAVAVQAQTVMTSELNNLSVIRTGAKSKRVSSADKTGKNADRIDIKPGEIKTIFEVSGAGAINHIWITIGPFDFKRNNLVLRMYWDGNDRPSVNTPLGAFFGQGWDEHYLYNSLPLTAGPSGGSALTSYFTMPFAHGAKIEVENQDSVPVQNFYFYVDYIEMKKLPAGLGRFHAWYNHELTEALPEGETEWDIVGKQQANIDGKDNYLFADIQGKGHFVGINYYVHCPSPMWYGEGDDMWTIDGEQRPSLLGTGTEDFFNTSWCPKEPFSHPYFGYPRVNDNVGWLGRTHVYRFFIADPVLFDTSLKATIEHGHNNNMTLDLSSVAYWYQSEATPVPDIPGVNERRPMPEIGVSEIHKWRHEWRKNKGNNPQLWGNE